MSSAPHDRQSYPRTPAGTAPGHARARGYGRWPRLCLVAGVLTCLAALPNARAIGTEREDDLITPAEYVGLLEQQRSAIHSLVVSYEQRCSYDEEVRERGRLAGFVLMKQDTAAFFGEKRLLHTVSHGLDSAGAAMDVERTAVFTGTDCRLREGKTFTIQTEKSAYSELNVYMSALLWPSTAAELESCRANPQGSHFLPYFIESGTWSVERATEPDSGTSCVLLQNHAHDRRLWLDPTRQYALLRYEQDNPVSGVGRWTFRYGSHKAILPGLYLPYAIHGTHEIIDYDTKEAIGEVRFDTTVTHLQVNSISDQYFTLEPAPGELVVDNVRRIIYRFNPADEGTLDRVTTQAVAARDRQRSSGSAMRAFVLINLFILGAVIVVLVSKALRRRRGVD